MDSRKVCKYWVAGKCNRSPCRFVHSADDDQIQTRTKEKHVWRRNPSCPNSKAALPLPPPPSRDSDDTPQCEKMLFISHDHTFSHVAQLQGQGHLDIINGIALPSPSASGSNFLCSASQDGLVRVWDCGTGQCVNVNNVGAKVTCMIGEGPWIFIGLVDMGVKVWNTHSLTELFLDIAPSTRVSSLVLSFNTLYVGTFDGFILSWKFNPVDNHFELAARIKAHPLAVMSLVYGANRLYSGSMDQSIKVWDVSSNSMHCTQTLTGHKSAVLSLLCWDHFLISCSLDKTILVWSMNEQEQPSLQIHYTHREDHGVLCLAGMIDEQRSKPVLMCSCTDNTVRLYDLPTLQERGKIFAKAEVRSILAGPHGLFFTGDCAGNLNVWKWSNSS